MTVACLSCDLPYAFISRVKDEETIFLVAGSDVLGIFNKFTDVDFRIETKRMTVLEDTNCMWRNGINSTENADLLSEHRNSHHLFIIVNNKSSNESDNNRTDN